MSAVRTIVGTSLVLLLATIAPAATIEGTIALPHAMAVPAANPRYPISASYTVGPPDPPAAVVYVEGGVPAPAPARAAVAQHRYQFSPGLLAIPRGSVVVFPNLDDEYHSVFSYSKPKRFDLGRYAPEETPAELTFDQPGVVKLFCEIHDHMRGTIVVVDAPYYQKTDPEGRYRIEGVPAGRHAVRAWVDDDTTLERAVDVGDDGTLRVDLP
jgi:plastocyanin